MKSYSEENKLKKLKHIGLFSSKKAYEEAKVAQGALLQWTQKGLIHKADRGLYFHPQAKGLSQVLDFAVPCSLFKGSPIIGGLSALFYYNLIDEVPQGVWLICPPHIKSERKDKKYRLLRTKTPLGISIHKKKYFRIGNLERTLIESLKFNSKIGLRICIGAARKALEKDLTSELKLGRVAKKLGMERVLEKYWEFLV